MVVCVSYSITPRGTCIASRPPCGTFFWSCIPYQCQLVCPPPWVEVSIVLRRGSNPVIASMTAANRAISASADWWRSSWMPCWAPLAEHTTRYSDICTRLFTWVTDWPFWHMLEDTNSRTYYTHCFMYVAVLLRAKQRGLLFHGGESAGPVQAHTGHTRMLLGFHSQTVSLQVLHLRSEQHIHFNAIRNRWNLSIEKIIIKDYS